ncbi:hypothetical protein SAMN05421810_101839 [Amycolatopsis arida]|uniref:Uncharacterized protein n=1 Tax=Amycolatopsis arida TaxID=587909 RepID=A0A1I5M920_9PSEU|nr:hypothetical protein [Amycolatopsis arida]TDX94013.1 hypothetical protein CLV69_104471 [Amycolatopsis arida]SFP06035.1 hypothetical protein SAMN05421810_101839 [Amycolatopsis arida]
MAHLHTTSVPVPVAGIAEPHQSTVEVILRGVRQGLFTMAEGELLIDRVRARGVPINDGRLPSGGELAPEAVQISRNRTVS